MRMNISIQLDDSDLSLLELLGAILGEEGVDAPAPIQEQVIEEEEPTYLVEVIDYPAIEETVETVEDKTAPVKETVCSQCGTTTTPLWRGRKDPNGPFCNRCGLRNRKKAQNEKDAQKYLGGMKELSNKLEEKKETPKSTKPTPKVKPFVKPVRGKSQAKQTKPTLKEMLEEVDQTIVGRRQIKALNDAGITTIEAFCSGKTKALVNIMKLHRRHDGVVESLQMRGTMMMKRHEAKLRLAEAEEKSKKTLKRNTVVEKKPKFRKKDNKPKVMSDFAWDALCHTRSLKGGVLMSKTVYDKAKSLIESKYDFGKKTMEEAGFSEHALMTEIEGLFMSIVHVKKSPNFLLGTSESGSYIVTLSKESWPSKTETFNTEA